MRFNELRLAEPIVRAVAGEGYTIPTPIQMKAIPEALAGRDVLGCAQTGTGKTGAFALPILHRLAEMTGVSTQANTARDGDGRGPRNGQQSGQRAPRRGTPRPGRPRALVLCPTRELADQIFESFKTYGRYLPLRHTVVYGGVSQFRQVRDLQAGIDVLVATPGRLHDLIQQGHIDLGGVEILTLDEADRMLDMGFIGEIRKVVELLPKRRQVLLFSATMPNEIRGLADSIQHDPVYVEVEAIVATADAIEQSVYCVTRQNKPALLQRLLDQDDVERTLIFSRTKYGADKIVKALRRANIDAGAIHGDKSQAARMRALQSFRNGRVPILVATDIASRGIDVDEISHVINYDVPNAPETYVHRIGRTARAGATGVAVTFCDEHEFADLRLIERLIGSPLTVNTDERDLCFEAPSRHEHFGKKSQKKATTAGGQRRPQGRSRNGQSAKAEGSSGATSGGTRKARTRNAAGATTGRIKKKQASTAGKSSQASPPRHAAAQ